MTHLKKKLEDEINYLSKMLANIKPQLKGLTPDDFWSLVYFALARRYRRLK